MGCWIVRRLRAAAWGLGVLALLAGCGGGGGGSGGGSDGAGSPAQTPQIGAVAWVQSAARAERDVFATSGQPAVVASLSIRAPGVPYWFRYSYDRSLADVTHTFRTADEGLDFRVGFLAGTDRAPGSYTDTLSVNVCQDEACTREVPGSPFKLPLRLDVGYFAQAEAGLAPAVPTATAVLAHDVVGAAYSAALDAVVTVSAQPAPLLRVHDLRSGQTRSVALATAPTSLSVGADGLQAAVGHDAAVSLVDLRSGVAAPVRRFAVPMPVGAVVLAATRIVAIGAQAFNLNSIWWLDTATGTASRAGATSIYGLGDAVLHPAGDRVYLADRGLSPDDISRMDLAGDPAAAQIHDTRYHGDYPFCSRVAAAPDGRRLYTGCGVVLSLAPALQDDMVYAGRMALSPVDPVSSRPYRAAALSVAPDSGSVALLEENQGTCEPLAGQLNDCHTRLALYDGTSLARRSLRGLAPFERGTDRLKQWGRRVMHRADGSLLVIAEVRTRNEATPTWLLHRLDP